MRGLIADVSYYQPEFNFRLFKDWGGTAVIIKSSMQLGFDPKFKDFVTRAKDAGIRLGLYHWVDPIPSRADKQVDLFSEAIQIAKPDFIAGDVEQWWNDWNGYYAYLYGRISYNEVPKISDNKISSFSRDWFARVSNIYPSLRLFVYSGSWFRKHSPSTSTWIGEYPYWGADYRKAPKKVMEYTEVKQWAEGIERLSLFKGAKNPKIHQFTSSVIIPWLNQEHGINKMVDLNLTVDSEEEFIRYIQGENVEPIPETEAKVKIKYWVSRLRIRPEPNFNKKEIGWVNQNELKTILLDETQGKWLKLKDEPGYIHMDYIDYIQ